MSRRNMSERMCTGLMLCEAAPCDTRFSSTCVLPRGAAVPRNKSFAEFIDLVGLQSPKLLNLLERIGAHNQTNLENPASMPELFEEDEKALLVNFMKKISAKGGKQEQIFNAMKGAFGITKEQIEEMRKLEPNKPRIPYPHLQPEAVIISA
jgi:hypothetical protein